MFYRLFGLWISHFAWPAPGYKAGCRRGSATAKTQTHMSLLVDYYWKRQKIDNGHPYQYLVPMRSIFSGEWEIARELNVSVQTVMNQKTSALKVIRIRVLERMAFVLVVAMKIFCSFLWTSVSFFLVKILIDISLILRDIKSILKSVLLVSHYFFFIF